MYYLDQFNKKNNYYSPNKVTIGVDVIYDIVYELKNLGSNKILIVTDPGVVSVGIYEKLKSILKEHGFDFDVYDNVEAEPSVRTLDDCLQIARNGNYDLIIGLGGGSALDVAKGTSALVNQNGNFIDFVGMNTIENKSIPCIIVPTTAGTGSEVTRVIVMTDEKENTKKVIYSDFLIPDVVILDPVLTVTMPPKVTADTGIDALVHSIEAYVSVNSTPYTDIFALKAIELIYENLPVAYSKGKNITSRFNMLLAANFAGYAFASGGLGAVHGLSYVLGTEYHLPHGRSNAIMLPHVMEYNLTGNLDRYINISMAMGENLDAITKHEAAYKAIESVNRLLQYVNISTNLKSYDIPESDLPKLVAGGLKQSRLFESNPKDLHEENISNIYKKAFQG